MGAVFAGAARAPITAVVIMFELTGEYSIILPLMAAVVLATGTDGCCRDTIYTAKLRRRGVDLDRSGLPPFTAAEIAGPAPRPLPADTDLHTAATILGSSSVPMTPCVDKTGRYAGCLSKQDLVEALHDPDPPATIAELLRHHRPYDRTRRPMTLWQRWPAGAVRGFPCSTTPAMRSSAGSPTKPFFPDCIPASAHPPGTPLDHGRCAVGPGRCAQDLDAISGRRPAHRVRGRRLPRRGPVLSPQSRFAPGRSCARRAG